MIITKDKFIKFLDYSSFKWDTFTLPFEGYQFFNIDELSQDKIDITLIDENNNTYSSYIRYTDKSRENSPTRLLKWNKDFTSYLKEHIPQWETIKKGEKSENFQLIFKPSDEPNVFYITISSKFSLVEDVNKRYFIFTTGKKENDVDFETYPWERSRFDKVREGDFFVYKKSSSLSENKKLYFFGMGQVGPIEGDDYVVTQIINPVKFDNIIHQEDLNDYQWKWKDRGENWSNFFNHYGMDIIPFEDFKYICEQGISNQTDDNFEKQNNDLIKSHKKFYFPNSNKKPKEKFSKLKVRTSDDKVWSDNIKIIYDFKCCVTDISTKGLNHSSHISPHSSDEENRLNPKNGLLLSMLIHKCFDEGIISIDDNYRILLSDSIKDKNLLDYLKKYENNKINLPIRKDFYPDRKLLKIHREKFGFE
tara:strand:+ start:5770 stop:7029 length:1260 start_codon:yes stop_codon:yes gene_type:complete